MQGLPLEVRPDSREIEELKEVYDAVVNVTILPEVGQGGWELELSPSRRAVAEKVLGPIVSALIENGQEQVRLSLEQLDSLSRAVLPDGAEKVVVSVVGLFDRGKTFLLNKLSGSQLPSSQRVHTKGISLKIPKGEGKGLNLASNIVLFDTEGTNAPLSKVTLPPTWEEEWEITYRAQRSGEEGKREDNVKQAMEVAGLASIDSAPKALVTPSASAVGQDDGQLAKAWEDGLDSSHGGMTDADWELWEEAKEAARARELTVLHEKAIIHKKVTENFLQNLIYTTSDVLVILVNELTWPDQQYIQAVCQYVQLHKLTCRIVIVHNFKTVTTCDGFLQQREV